MSYIEESTPIQSTADLTQAVLDAVAEAEGTNPRELDPPLYEAINPEALNELFAGKAGDRGWVGFDYHGYHVVVYRDGRVDIER